MRQLQLLGVRRFGEDEATPIVIGARRACGTFGDHIEKGCIGLSVASERGEGLIHLSSEDAMRLSDLLRAMAATGA